MGLIPIILQLSNIARKSISPYRYDYITTVLNGDLDASALDQMQLFTGDTIAIKGSTAYWLFTANGQSDGVEDVDQIFLATKNMNDGLPIYEGWTKYDNGTGLAVPVLAPVAGTWKDYQTFVRTVFYDKEQGIFKMWYGGDDRTTATTRFRTGYATSSDCITWTDYGSNPIYENFVTWGINGSVVFQVYKESPTLYHAMVGGSENANTIGATYLTSNNGINWTQQSTGHFVGTDVRYVNAIRKINGLYYLFVASGFNNTYHQTLGGIAKTIGVYTTTNFSTLTKVTDIKTGYEPSEAGLFGSSLFDYNGKYYLGYTYYKNQIKNIYSGGEPFSALRILQSNRPFYEDQEITKIYPDYLKWYVPAYEDGTQSVIERITNRSLNITGTLSWTAQKFVSFTGTQLITDTEIYVPNNPAKFAVKARILPQSTLTRHIIRQDGTSRGWSMYLSAGKLEVVLFDSDGNIAKRYTTTNNVVKPSGVYDYLNHVNVGFIFDSGTLKLCFGDSCDQPVTKTNDSALAEIVTGDNYIEIGYNNVTNEMRSFCIFDEITEDQWLYDIDL